MLIATGLDATGMICEIWSRGTCPPPTPQTGAVVELRDLATGGLLWSVQRTVAAFSSSATPAISPDGRYALIMLPREGDLRETIALIAMDDGRIVQRLGMVGIATSFGFAGGGRTIWLANDSTVATYRFR